jgi:hypothetical protein
MPVGHRGPRSARALLALAAVDCATLLGAGGPAAQASGASTTLNDITEGSNFTPDTVCGYLCTAEPGYDGPTGLGTPNGIGGF